MTAINVGNADLTVDEVPERDGIECAMDSDTILYS
jgi:hypothetical protein